MFLSTEPQYLFVYGTLRSRFQAHRIFAGRAHPVGLGQMSGRLYDTGSYPGAVAATTPHDRVHGELYRLDPESATELLLELDRYEGFLPDAPEESLFRRVRAEVTTENGSLHCAWVYLFNRSVRGLARVPSGDYTDHLRHPERAEVLPVQPQSPGTAREIPVRRASRPSGLPAGGP
jgi:gamma-glutamylcyclotransferase (GGCT)/AIG2-like uncharacterized protein YtfP